MTCEICRIRQKGLFQLANGLFEAIKHGDAEHQAWLKQAIFAYFGGSAPVDVEFEETPQKEYEL